MAKSNQTDYRRIQDTDGSEVAVNDIGAIIAAQDSHERTAQDVEYYYEHVFTDVAAGSTVTVTVLTNSKFPHGNMSIDCDNSWEAELSLSTSTDPTGGTQDYQFNINRGANHERSVASFYFGDTSCGTVGNLHKTLETGRAEAGKFSVPVGGDSIDWLLDDSRAYIIHLKNTGGDAATIIFKYRYHEHDPVSVDIASGSGEDETEYSPVV